MILPQTFDFLAAKKEDIVKSNSFSEEVIASTGDITGRKGSLIYRY